MLGRHGLSGDAQKSREVVHKSFFFKKEKIQKQRGLTPNGEVKTAQKTKSELQRDCAPPHKATHNILEMFFLPQQVNTCMHKSKVAVFSWKKGGCSPETNILTEGCSPSNIDATSKAQGGASHIPPEHHWPLISS